MGSWVPYGESKLANVGHMLQLSKLKPNIQCFAVHPGVVKTGLAEPWKNNWPWTFSVIGPVMNLFLKSSFEGNNYKSLKSIFILRFDSFYHYQRCKFFDKFKLNTWSRK